MKFYSKIPHDLVWDKSYNKILCKFNKGIFETEDKRVIERLIELQYKHDEVTQCKDDNCEVKEMTNAEIKAMLDEKEIEYNNRATKSELLGLLDESN